MNAIRNIEIFRSGTHNGDQYTEADLDDMVAAFHRLDYRPALKVGHTKDASGAPAYGWISNLRRAGQKLLADFTDMHESVVEAIRSKAYNRVSAEVFHNLRRAGEVFPRALKAVALLGAEVPAVAGLVPLHKMEFAEFDALERTAAFSTDLKIEHDDPGAEVDRRAREHMRKNPICKDYSAAMDAVFADDPGLRREYLNEEMGVPPGKQTKRRERIVAADEVERLAAEVRRGNPRMSEIEVQAQVKADHPELWEVYARIGGR